MRSWVLVWTIGLLWLGWTTSGRAQEQPADKQDAPAGYEFTIEVDVTRMPVKSQDNTGTCWSFATASFLESEFMRMGKGPHDLSEMFNVKNVYQDKARNFYLRQGKANFSEGALAHDYLNAAQRYGLVPNEVYSGLRGGNARHDHGEMVAMLEAVLNTAVKRGRVSENWWGVFQHTLDIYLGESPGEFSYQGQVFTPQTFAEYLGFDADHYVHLTSYSHHPFGRPFVLEIPDNFSNGSFLNVPIDELEAIVDRALDAGFTVCWDGDVSERGFLRDKGIAVMPAQENSREFMRSPVEELSVDQALRQKTFENLSTTDDHLMHLVGRGHDQNGVKYYLIKNSWGEVGEHRGMLYMSQSYFRLKTVAISVHRDAVQHEGTTPSGE
ncbi:MAG TPA: C1 family peptidase [Pirellulaceae bacterium]|nr:C1 family peptidase [Pirellulaceae bacterium]